MIIDLVHVIGILNRVPIVALTANAQESDRKECIASGMDGFLTKPVTMPKLDEEIMKFQQSSFLSKVERVSL
jgi:CheY-like chemotaxis protein